VFMLVAGAAVRRLSTAAPATSMNTAAAHAGCFTMALTLNPRDGVGQHFQGKIWTRSSTCDVSVFVGRGAIGSGHRSVTWRAAGEFG
jgi:hypothetical protein